MNYLLDTNIVSELLRQEPDSMVSNFVKNLNDFHISAITVYELRFGTARLKSKIRKDGLNDRIDYFLSRFPDGIIPVGTEEAELAATLRGSLQLDGTIMHLEDSLIAATALTHNLTLATRNTKDFHKSGVPLFNPWA